MTTISAITSLLFLALFRNIIPLVPYRISCTLDILPAWLLYQFANTMFFLRVAFLKADAYKTNTTVTFFEMRSNSLHDLSEFNRNSAAARQLVKIQALLKDSKVFLYAGIFYIVHVLPNILYPIIYSENSYISKDDDLCYNNYRWFASLCAIAFISFDFIVAIYVILSIKGIKESWGIKSEFRAIGLNDIILVSGFISNTISIQKFEYVVNIAFGAEVFFLFFEMIPITVLVYYSLIKVSKAAIFQMDQSKSVQDTSDSKNEVEESLLLLKMLNSPFEFSLFQEHLKKEFYYSFLMFWKDVEQFKAKSLDALTILETYIYPKSPSYLAFPDNIVFFNSSAC
jgi:hypothetical protein